MCEDRKSIPIKAKVKQSMLPINVCKNYGLLKQKTCVWFCIVYWRYIVVKDTHRHACAHAIFFKNLQVLDSWTQLWEVGEKEVSYLMLPQSNAKHRLIQLGHVFHHQKDREIQPLLTSIPNLLAELLWCPSSFRSGDFKLVFTCTPIIMHQVVKKGDKRKAISFTLNPTPQRRASTWP